MISAPLRGVVPPVCTPLTADHEVDVPSLERLLDFLLEAEVDGLFMLGSTSEVAFLPDAHRRTVLDVAVARAAGRVPVLAGAIDMTTLRVLDHVRAAADSGCDAVVVTAPFYTRTHPAEIDRHFRMIAGILPVFAYDIPVAVHSKLPGDLLTAWAEDGVIAGLKDSSGDEAALRSVILETRETTAFSVLTGSETTVDTALRMGAHGVVPGLGNVDPHGYVRLYRHCLAGDWDAAAKEQERLIRLFRIVNAGAPDRMGRGSSALGAFKAALHLRGIIDCPVTAPPQIPLEDKEIDVVRRRLADAGLD
ncbi:MAG TPA: dihydrodipicolinate synthase family protein [Amycolatopsis sp.]|nr:dihydrodipicolinate synthase family protein [Amycolatopsis sp.]